MTHTIKMNRGVIVIAAVCAVIVGAMLMPSNVNAAQVPTVSLWATYNNQTLTTIVKGSALTLHWSSTNATECHKLAGAGFDTNDRTSGSDVVSPLAGSTTFSIKCTGPGGSKQANATVNTWDPNTHIWATLNGNTVTTVPYGTAPTLNWSSNQTQECHHIDGAGLDTGGRSVGSDVVSPLLGKTTFSIRCSGFPYLGHSVQANATVYVSNDPPAVQQKPTVQTTSATGIGYTYATLNGRVNPNNTNTTYWFEYGTTYYNLQYSTTHMGAGSGSSSVAEHANINYLHQKTNYYFRMVAQNSAGTAYGSVLSFMTLGSVLPPPPSGGAPTAYTNSASGVYNNSATLKGTVNPNHSATSYWFEWGKTTGLGYSTQHQSAGSGSSNVSASQTISGLSTNTTYYFRVVAQNSYGTTHGSILSFTTSGVSPPSGSAPIVNTQSASNISGGSATLNGNVNPNGADTSYWFEFGQNSGLGNSTTHTSIGSGNGYVNGAYTLSGFSENTTYYFRIVAQNSYGTTRGSILSFTTQTTSGNEPTIQTNSASNIGYTYATFNGNVNPNDSNTTYWFEYGTTSGLGYSTTHQSAGSGNSSVSISYSVSNLTENTTYYFRAVASNSYGTVRGSILNFTTGTGGGGGNAPNATTMSAQNQYGGSALLQGTVNPNNSATSYWFEWGHNSGLGYSTPYQSAGSGSGTVNASYYLSGLSDNTTYYFRIVAQNSNDTSYGQILSFVTNGNGYGDVPIVSTYTPTNIQETSASLYGSVNPNGSYTTAWFEWGTGYNSLYYTTNTQSMSSGSYDRSFYQSVSNLQRGTTYYYRAVARNDNGTSYGQVRSFTTNGTGYNQQPLVTTNNASGIGQNSALLNGSVNPQNSAATAWFEYGPTTSLGFSTTPQAMGSSDYTSAYAHVVSGLLPNTAYYFRAVAQNAAGITRGSILSFITSQVIINPPTPKPPIIIPPVPIPTGGTSCLVLVPSLNVDQLHSGKSFTYTITYHNGCNYSLSNTFLKVILPSDVNFDSTNYPFFNRDANGISYNLGVVPTGAQSAISISGTVGSVNTGDTLIYSSVMNFNDNDGTFQSVSSYLSAVVGSGSTLGANILTAFGDLFGNWLFILLLFLLILFLIWWIFFKKDEKKDERVDVLQEKNV